MSSTDRVQVTLLENVRFYKEETKNVPEFAEKMAANADMFVNDAFGALAPPPPSLMPAAQTVARLRFRRSCTL